MKKLIALACLAVTLSVLHASPTKVYTAAELQNMNQNELAKVNNTLKIIRTDSSGNDNTQYIIPWTNRKDATISAAIKYFRFVEFNPEHTKKNPWIPPKYLSEQNLDQYSDNVQTFDLFKFYDQHKDQLFFEDLSMIELATEIDEAKHATGWYAKVAEEIRNNKLAVQKQRKAEAKFEKEKPNIESAYQALIQQATKIDKNTHTYQLSKDKFLQAFALHEAQLYFTCPYGTTENPFTIVYYGSLLCYACAQGMLDLAKHLLENDLATPEYVNHNFDTQTSAYYLLMYAQLGAQGLHQRLTDEQCKELVQLLQTKGAQIPNIDATLPAIKTRKNKKGKNVIFGPIDKTTFTQKFLTKLIPAAKTAEENTKE